MLKQEELNNLCDGLEKVDRKDGIKKLMAKGCGEKSATNIYNTWRRHYVTTLINIT
ncbi:hypothetical protein [Clostridium autoethanogenum]|uniref:hypothetical protein n=1 Tax=Clostridium autoethanogenum TaxID=84023 RepID=UPI001604B3D2|nr:hypothetical protein [Clostridium autoethanogenum]